MKIITVVGARPNFIKVAPFIHQIKIHNKLVSLNNNGKEITHFLVHTGQHYDKRMSHKFFNELDIPHADINMGVGSGSHAEQVGNTMIAFEKVLIDLKPDWVVVVGDVNATLASAITAKKLNVKVCHIEAGLRSFDIEMPEEINRIVTDRLADLLLTPDKLSVKNLINEGVKKSNIEFVGNIMIDTLMKHRRKAGQIKIDSLISKNSQDYQVIDNSLIYSKNNFLTLTIHRPSNVDSKSALTSIIYFIQNNVTSFSPVIWPVHPRTENKLKSYDLWNDLLLNDRVILLKPLGYHEMLKLSMDSKIVLTDSGGIQEECSVLGTPCLTLRNNTERPITLNENQGTCRLAGNEINSLKSCFDSILVESKAKQQIPDLWDGATAKRCLDAILSYKS